MNPTELKGALEAIIYAADEPATLDQIAKAVGEEKAVVRAALDEMIAGLRRRGSRHRNPRRRWRLQVLHQAAASRSRSPLHQEPAPAAAPDDARARNAGGDRLPAAPSPGPEIQEIRGVNVSGVIKTLLEKRLIVTAGRKAVMGRPIMYRTSKEFLMRFGLSDLEELPSLKEFEQLARAALGSDEGIAPIEPEAHWKSMERRRCMTRPRQRISANDDSRRTAGFNPSPAADEHAAERRDNLSTRNPWKRRLRSDNGRRKRPCTERIQEAASSRSRSPQRSTPNKPRQKALPRKSCKNVYRK